MRHCKFLILGAGPAGLAFAHTLLDHGETDFLVLEKEQSAGGLCRSAMVDGSPLDTGGGHFLDTRNKRVLEFVFRFLPETEWKLYDRVSTIDFGSHIIDYPIESNIWQLPRELQVEYLISVSQAGENLGTPAPEDFGEWITWKLGERIAEDYMLPYNRKIWSIDLSRLGTYWMEKLPAASFREVLESCLNRRAAGTIPAHRSFYYPAAYGYGEAWDRMGRALGDRLITGQRIHRLDIAARQSDGLFSADVIINTIPWTSIELPGLPSDVAEAVRRLDHTGIRIGYHETSLATTSQWIYVPGEETPHHRILNRSVFVPGSRGYWTETNLRRRAGEGLTVAVNDFAYPLNTREKPGAIRAILDYAAKHHVFGLGRWGTWEHINSDVAVDQGISLAGRLLQTSPA